MPPLRTAMLHYSAPPVIGGVESVIQAHAKTFIRNGVPVTVVAGRGEGASLPAGTEFLLIPELDSMHPSIIELNQSLEQGQVPDNLSHLVNALIENLATVLGSHDVIIVHNVFTKHFNLPLTAALHTLLDAGAMGRCIAWCHDFTWSSPRSRSKVHPGHPWDLLRTHRPDLTYVVVSQRRQQSLAALLKCDLADIHVVYNGVDPQLLIGLSDTGFELINRMGLLESDLILLMPVRITQAKNIEYALHVLAAIKEKGLHSKLVVTGPPDPHDSQNMTYFGSLQSLRNELHLEEDAYFIAESGSEDDHPFTINMPLVSELYRVSDVMFMPSHREGFGMPILEAGLAGVPVVSADVPAAEEIGGPDLLRFRPTTDPALMAEQLLSWVDKSPVHRLRRRMRHHFTWQAIFERTIRPLLEGNSSP